MSATDQFLHFIGTLTCILGAMRVLLPFFVTIYYETMSTRLLGQNAVRRQENQILVGEAQKSSHHDMMYSEERVQ